MTKKAFAGSLLLLTLGFASSCGESGDGDDATGGVSGQGGGAGVSGGNGGSAGTSSSKGGAGGNGSSGESNGGGPSGASGGESGTAGESAGAGGDAGAGGSATDCPSVNSFPQAYARHICAKNIECCGSEAATCASTVEAALRGIYNELAAAVAAGSAEFDCNAYLECVAAVDAASCDDWPKELRADFGIPVDAVACRSIVVGTLQSGVGAGGEACTEDYQCVNGFCRDPDGEGAEGLQCIEFKRTGETCLTPAEAGEQMDISQLCSPVTHFCNEASHMCEARREDGSLCTAGSQCASRECTEGECVEPTVCEHVPEEPVMCSVAAPGARTRSGSGFAALWTMLFAAGLFRAPARKRFNRS